MRTNITPRNVVNQKQRKMNFSLTFLDDKNNTKET